MKPDHDTNYSESRIELQCQEGEASPPPFYGKHELDRIISAPPELRFASRSTPPVVSGVGVY